MVVGNYMSTFHYEHVAGTSSNSIDRFPTNRPFSMWVVAISVSIISISAIEAFWRSNGYVSTISDDTMLWCNVRDHLQQASSQSLVIVGHSRIRQAFDAEAFKEVAPHVPVHQLAIFNSNPILSLRDIAENTDYSGVVLCSMLSHCLLPEQWGMDEESYKTSTVVNFYHQDWNLAKKFDRGFRTQAQQQLSLLHPDLSVQFAIPNILRDRWPVQWIWTNANRTQRVEYAKVDLDVYTKSRLKSLRKIMDRTTSLDGYKHWPDAARLDRIQAWVAAIQDRGGHVVFFRPVTSGAYAELIDEYFPREKFWDYFANRTTAETIHFRDIPAISRMQCAEGSHLFERDTADFTKLLAQELRQRGMFSTTQTQAGLGRQNLPPGRGFRFDATK